MSVLFFSISRPSQLALKTIIDGLSSHTGPDVSATNSTKLLPEQERSGEESQSVKSNVLFAVLCHIGIHAFLAVLLQIAVNCAQVQYHTESIPQVGDKGKVGE